MRLPSVVIAATAVAGVSFLIGAAASPGRKREGGSFFETSDRCIACHNGVTTSTGEDVSIGSGWRPTMMANSARDPYWHAAVRREVMDHPGDSVEIQNDCARCHMPMAQRAAAAVGRPGRVFANLPIGALDGDEARLAADGVSCALCHQIGPDGLGDARTQSGRFHIDTITPAERRPLYGPFQIDSGRRRVMHSASGFIPVQGTHIQTASFCASCHTLQTHALGAGAGQTLPEQTPYLEWRASSFAGRRTCQSCHMPEVAEDVPVTGVLGVPRSNVSRHDFPGANFFMLRMLARYRQELGVAASPHELSLAVDRTILNVQTNTARIEVSAARADDGRLHADVVVRNLTGHKLPTAYPSRRAWLHTTVRDAAGAIVFESGAFSGDGSVAGNDGDRAPGAYEPHHEIIERPDQVQVYESVMADASGRPTTGLLSAVRYLKDNRLLPEGFDRQAAGSDAAVQGTAARDSNFVGGSDRVRYVVDVGGRSGPFRVEVSLWYQPIGFRWARNLADYDAPEPRRFVAWFDAMASGSAIVVAAGQAVTSR